MTRTLMLAAVLAASCSRAAPETASHFDMSNKDRLDQLAEVLRVAQDTLKRAPAKADELEKFRRMGPMALQALKAGDLVVIWGANFGSGTGVIAYEKGAPTAGGWVLTQDGKTRTMTAAEFAAAPKAR